MGLINSKQTPFKSRSINGWSSSITHFINEMGSYTMPVVNYNNDLSWKILFGRMWDPAMKKLNTLNPELQQLIIRNLLYQGPRIHPGHNTDPGEQAYLMLNVLFDAGLLDVLEELYNSEENLDWSRIELHDSNSILIPKIDNKSIKYYIEIPKNYGGTGSSFLDNYVREEIEYTSTDELEKFADDYRNQGLAYLTDHDTSANFQLQPREEKPYALGAAYSFLAR